MNSALVIHTIEDAQHCMKNRLNQENMLFSTNSCVDIYLKENFKVDCKSLSNFLTTDEIRKFKEQTSQAVDKILQELDSKISHKLNSRFNLKMRYFTPLYSYLGKHQFFAYLCFMEAIQKVEKIFELKSFYFYNYKFNDFFSISTNMSNAISLMNKESNFKVIKYRQKKIKEFESKIKKFLWKIRKRFLEPKTIVQFLTKNIKNKQIRVPLNHKTILIYEPLFELRFLKESLPNYNLVYYRHNDLYPVGFSNAILKNSVNIKFRSLDLDEEFENPLSELFFNDIREDFLNNISQYISAIKLLDKINSTNQISLGIWDYGPIEKMRSLVIEYLRSKNVKVLGAQHGCLFGDSYEPWHFDSEFNRCDFFISYGFTNEDLKRLYPNINLKVNILPFGKYCPIKNNKTKKCIDILFPITMNFSIFNAGMARVLPHILLERHMKIFEYLNSLKDFNIYIKPFPLPTYNDCSVLSVLKRLRNIKVVTNMSLNEFLSKYNPRAVILDLPSQPLFEILHLDVEIFLLNDTITPFAENSLKELKKRVHYFEYTNELIQSVNLFLEGKLKKKRDSDFIKHYVYKENREKNILNLINQLSE